MIDLVVMRKSQRACCKDVQVMRGANCWTDHKLVRAKLSFGLPSVHKGEKKLLPFSVHRFSSAACRDEYKTSPTMRT